MTCVKKYLKTSNEKGRRKNLPFKFKKGSVKNGCK